MLEVALFAVRASALRELCETSLRPQIDFQPRYFSSAKSSSPCKLKSISVEDFLLRARQLQSWDPSNSSNPLFPRCPALQTISSNADLNYSAHVAYMSLAIPTGKITPVCEIVVHAAHARIQITSRQWGVTVLACSKGDRARHIYISRGRGWG